MNFSQKEEDIVGSKEWFRVLSYHTENICRVILVDIERYRYTNIQECIDINLDLATKFMSKNLSKELNEKYYRIFYTSYKIAEEKSHTDYYKTFFINKIQEIREIMKIEEEANK